MRVRAHALVRLGTATFLGGVALLSLGAPPVSAAPALSPRLSTAHVYPAGGVIAYGDAGTGGLSLLASKNLTSPVVSLVASPTSAGFWIAGADGAVYAVGGAPYFGSFLSAHIAEDSPVVGMASTPDGAGYWLLNQGGGVFCFGDARFFGSLGNLTLNQPVVAMASSSDGGGYWLVAADGGVFSFGDAHFWGSAGSLPLQAPIMSAAATHDGKGYYLVAADGGVFAYGDAHFWGSAVSKDGMLGDWNASIVGMALTPDGKGYQLAASNGNIFCYGTAVDRGAETSDPSMPVNAIAPTLDGGGYWLLEPDGFNYTYANPLSPALASGPGIVTIAESQVAPDQESGFECNPYGPCEYWCSLFTDWVWQQVGVPIPSDPLAENVYRWSASNASILPIGPVPPVGDVILYGTGPPPGITYHVGVVVQTWPNGAIVTIEGDSGPNLDGHYSVTINGPFLPGDDWAYNNFPAYAYAQPY